MITRYAGASLALLAFSTAITAGLVSRNAADVVLSRGLLALLLFFPLGLALGWAAQRVVDEYARQGEERIRTKVLSGQPQPDSGPLAEARTGAGEGAKL